MLDFSSIIPNITTSFEGYVFSWTFTEVAILSIILSLIVGIFVGELVRGLTKLITSVVLMVSGILVVYLYLGNITQSKIVFSITMGLFVLLVGFVFLVLKSRPYQKKRRR